MRALVQRATLNHVSETTASDTKEIRTIFSLYSPVGNSNFWPTIELNNFLKCCPIHQVTILVVGGRVGGGLNTTHVTPYQAESLSFDNTRKNLLARIEIPK